MAATRPRAARDRYRQRRRRRRERRDRLLVAGLNGMRRLAHLLGARLTVGLAAAVARLTGRVLAKPRALAQAQLAQALPESTPHERRELVNQMFDGLGRSVGELLLFDRITADLDAWVRLEGAELLDRALAAGRGVITISGHIGNWELLAATLALKGYPLTVVATEVKGRRLNEENVRLRAACGVATILRSAPGSARELLGTLRRGRVLGLLIDQDTRVQSVEVPFFGRLARTPVGAASLALRTGAPILGTFIHRERDGRHVVRIIEPELPARPADDVGPAQRAAARASWHIAATAAATKLIEDVIRQHPETWVWWHRRWGEGDTRPGIAVESAA